MRFKIGIFGSAAGADVQKNTEKARIIGECIAGYKGIIITGACGGLPHTVAEAAADKGGLVIGVSPAINMTEHIEKFKFPVSAFYNFIFTGMGKKGRNIISVRSCDAAIFIGGRIGTLNELTIAYDEAPSEGFMMGILTGTGGLSEEFSRLVEKSGKKSSAIIIKNNDPQSLVDEIFSKIRR